jgi:hypothetical protein
MTDKKKKSKKKAKGTVLGSAAAFAGAGAILGSQDAFGSEPIILKQQTQKVEEEKSESSMKEAPVVKQKLENSNIEPLIDQMGLASIASVKGQLSMFKNNIESI